MAIQASSLTTHDRTVLAELEELVRETYRLWDQTWVGFSWRNYTFDHVIRVRKLALTLAEREGGDLRALDFGALLHDVTKTFDGEVLMRDGKRVVDENGFWLNQKLPPARQNRVTELYDQLELAETVHHVSGAAVASALLKGYGYDAAFQATVSEIITAHLKPPATTSIAGFALYDADTIDANIGLPAFFRNIQISTHRLEREYQERHESLDDYLVGNLPTYLVGYLGERVPNWVNGKRDDFISKLTTDSGRAVARDRIVYMNELVPSLVDELANYPTNARIGRLAIIRAFFEHRDNPSLARELADLREEWARRDDLRPAAREFLIRYESESNGLL